MTFEQCVYGFVRKSSLNEDDSLLYALKEANLYFNFSKVIWLNRPRKLLVPLSDKYLQTQLEFISFNIYASYLGRIFSFALNGLL